MKFATINGFNLHFKTSGNPNGVPVVFGNSLGTDLRTWDAVAAQLGEQYRIVQYDKRGHGLSGAPQGPYKLDDFVDDLAQLLDHLEIERAVLVGVSIGGLISLAFARRFPSRVLGVVACDTGLKIGSAETWNVRIEAVQNGGLASIADAVMARWFPPHFLTSHPRDVAGYRQMVARQPAHGYVATCAALRDADVRATDFSGLRGKALVLCGSDDASTPPELSEEVARALNAPLHMLAGVGHLPNLQDPDTTATHILDFLDQLP